MSLAWKKAFGLLQTQFGTQKQWYDKVFGETYVYGTHVCVKGEYLQAFFFIFFSKFWFSGSLKGKGGAVNFVFWGFKGDERAENDLKLQFQYVLLYISVSVDHIIKILIISTGVFLYFFKKNATL